MKFSIKDLFSKRDQIRKRRRIWSHLLMKPLIENFTFCAVNVADGILRISINKPRYRFYTESFSGAKWLPLWCIFYVVARSKRIEMVGFDRWSTPHEQYFILFSAKHISQIFTFHFLILTRSRSDKSVSFLTQYIVWLYDKRAF